MVRINMLDRCYHYGLGLLILISLCLAAAPGANADDSLVHTPPAWRELLPGLDFSTIQALKYCHRGNKEIAVLRVNPEYITFEAFHYSISESKRIQAADKWREELNAPVVVNAGLFDEDYRHLGILMHKGKNIGSPVHKQWKGIFVATPLRMGLPPANIIDLNYSHFDPDSGNYLTAVQSMMLFDDRGNKRIRKSEWLANRTVIGIDKLGRIVIMVTKGAYTLWEMAGFLQESSFEIKKAMSLDGGPASELVIKTDSFFYSIFGMWSSNDSGDHSFPGIKMELPAVIALFPRQLDASN